MARFITFTTYEDEDPQVMTEAEREAAGEAFPDWAEYVWQNAPDRETAIAQHAEKMNAYEADNNAGRPIQDTY